MIKRIAFLFVACSAMCAQQADGSLLIFVDDFASGGIEVIVEDGLGAGVLSSYSGLFTTHADTNGTSGIVSFGGGVGPNISFASVTGFGNPVISPYIIDTLAASITASAGTYRIATAQTGFSGLVAGTYGVNNQIGGTSTAGASLTTMYGANSANTMFAGPAGTVGPLTGSPFSGTGDFSTGLGPGPFSISQWVTIGHSSSGITTFDMSTQVVVPEPGTIAIWSVFAGLGLVGGLRRRLS